MSSELVWGLIRDNNSFIVKRNGIILSREAGNLAQVHSFKYSGLAQPKVIKIAAGAEGVSYVRRSAKAPAGAVAKAYPVRASVMKKGACGATKAVKVARDLEANGYRLDLSRAAQARVCALLGSYKERKAAPLSARKLAKLSKKN